jgi:hypothetical protein
MKRTQIYALVIPLFVVIAVHAQTDLPVTANAGWMEKAASVIKLKEYSFYSHQNTGEFRAFNHANRISSSIKASGYTISATDANDHRYEANFLIKSIAGVATDPSASISVSEKELTFTTNTYQIQYLNDESGLRQNFIINQRPVSGNLNVQMTIQSSLDIRIGLNNQLLFSTSANKKNNKLIYDGLKVTDANGKLLDASMKYDNNDHSLVINVDDAHAAYPVTIDPLNRTPEWTTSADGILPGLLTNLQLQVHALYGYTVAGLGDINGDGFDDVAVSAPAMADVISGNGNLTAVGAVFIYLGSPSGLPITPSKVLQPTTAVDGALFGYSIDAGDITGDGKNDIIIGAPLDRYQTSARALIGTVNVEVTAGKVYVYNSESLFSAPNPTPFAEIRLQGSTFFSSILNGLFQSNVTVHSLFGHSVAVTPDVNGDGKADIIIGSPSYLGIQLLSAQSGAAFVYYSDNLNTVSPVQLETPSPTLLGLPLLPLANTTGLLFGYSVDGAGDFNQDGFRDVIVGAPAGADLSSLGGIFTGQFLGGTAYIFYGSVSGINTTSSVKLQADATGLLSNAANLFGYKVKGAENAAGNKTGNVLIGAPNGAVSSNVIGGLRVKAGQLHVVKKKPGGTGTYASDQIIQSPRSTSILSILSGQTIDLSVLFASSIDNMMDVNCDNIGDIIVGEPLSSAVPMVGADVVGGAAYVYIGKPDGTYQPTPLWDLNVTISPMLGVNATSLIGYCVAGAGYTKGHAQGVRSLVGGPSNTLDFGAGLLNLGNTFSVLFSFVFDENGLGKSYSFPYTTCNIVLPVTLIDFRGQQQNRDVLLNWTSVLEDNLGRYELQRSTDGLNYQAIAIVFPKGSQHNEYDYIDHFASKGVNYYRLKMIDLDNSIKYSTIVLVNLKSTDNISLDVSPNPAQNLVTLRLYNLSKGNYTIELINLSGQKIIQRFVTVSSAFQKETLNLDKGIQAGMYWIKVYNSSTGEKAGSTGLIVTGQ